MIAFAAIIDGPVTTQAEAAARSAIQDDLAHAAQLGSVGARFRFEGIVRRLESGRELVALDYRTYDPMAEGELRSLARDVAERHGLSSIIVLHSRGRVAVGQASFTLEVSSPHRPPALAAIAEFIERLKQDVPIWKQPAWA